MRREDFLSLRWLDEARPLIEPPFPSPVAADPSFLFPEESPDGLWALAAHDAFGIRLYRSRDGLSWDRGRYIAKNRMRPFLRRLPRAREDTRDSASPIYLLYAEAYRPLALPLQILPRRPRWRSRIVLSESPDLWRWSRPQTLLEPEAPWARSDPWGESVSNPCLVMLPEGGARLYHSAGLANIPDCGFEEPRVIALAEGLSPRGPFGPLPGPLISPESDPLPGVLGSGSLKVLAMEDGFIGLQNKIYAGADGRSRSALFLLESRDGLSWSPARGRDPSEPFLAPGPGWRSSHVYACDCRQSPADGRFYLYYNARDGWYKTEGKERVGRLVSE